MKSYLLISVILLNSFGYSLSAYEESLARNKMLALSGAAYSNNPSACLKNAFVNAKLQRQYEVKCDFFKSDTCSGFTAVSHSDKAIIVSFRGSSGFLQIVSEAGESAFEKKVASPIGGSVSEYFYDAFNKVWTAGMKNDFLTLKNSYPSYKVWVTGHSLGGSMASIAASAIIGSKYVPASKVFLYTFGQPRTGDKTFAQKHDAISFGASYRITHSHDIVPHVPPENFESYYHHKSEVWYNNDMKIGQPHVECDADESKDCSDHNIFDLSINDHLHYFDKDVSGFGDDGCIASFQQFYPKYREEDFKNVPHDKPEQNVEIKKN